MGRSRRRRPERLAEKLLFIRQELALSQDELINRINRADHRLHKGDISNFELNKSEPQLEILLRYARLGGVTVDVLIDDDLEIPRSTVGKRRKQEIPILAPGENIRTVQNPLLVVVDMQLGFLNENSMPVVPSVLRLIQECEQLRLPIVFTKFINRPASSFEILLDWKGVRNEPEIDLHDAFKALGQTAMFEKHYYTVFTGEFDDFIHRKNCQTLLISGVSTESCVLKTALDAFERGLRPVVVSDACASDQGPKVHLQALELIKSMIGQNQVKTVDEVVSEVKSVDRTVV